MVRVGVYRKDCSLTRSYPNIEGIASVNAYFFLKRPELCQNTFVRGQYESQTMKEQPEQNMETQRFSVVFAVVARREGYSSPDKGR